jgi:arylsulfatase A-like enzyme
VLVSYFLVDRLPEALIEAPGPDHVAIQPITIERDTRSCIFQHPVSRVSFSEIRLGKHSSFKYSLGIKEGVWEKLRAPIIFRVCLIDKKGRLHKLNETSLDVAQTAERGWRECELNLKQFDGQTVTLVLETAAGGNGDCSWAWAGWGNPCVTTEEKKTAPLVVKNSRPNVLLVVADALRADHLACYGHPQVQTPNLDALAADGALFTCARTASATTLGSLNSLLTGLSPLKHGVNGEWGEAPHGLNNLPGFLAGQGFETVAVVSEREYGEGAGGLMNWFEHQVPCLGMPMQAGDITTRRFIQWLDRRSASSDKGFFAWLHYFDTHPPAIAPEPFKSMYYRGNPSDPLRAYDSRGLKLIYGIESILELEAAMSLLEANIWPVNILLRLEDTCKALLGEIPHGPDLAEHLHALEANYRFGLEPEAFAQWLLSRLALLGAVPAKKINKSIELGPENLVALEAGRELLVWIKLLLPRLKVIEEDITGWLKGVVDLRYAQAQYMSEVSYLDSHIGMLVQSLKERGLYDSTNIVFLAPHGEVLGEHGLYFHHLCLTEEVLRVPVIIKAAQSLQQKKGCRVAGVFDLVDLFPTLCELLGERSPANIDGKSRFKEMLAGTDIAEHDSISVDYNHDLVSLTSGRYVFIKALSDVVRGSQWTWQAGDKALYELRTPMSYQRNLLLEMPDVALTLERRLDKFLENTLVPEQKLVVAR